jgi:hypothetical protein
MSRLEPRHVGVTEQWEERVQLLRRWSHVPIPASLRRTIPQGAGCGWFRSRTPARRTGSTYRSPSRRVPDFWDAEESFSLEHLFFRWFSSSSGLNHRIVTSGKTRLCTVLSCLAEGGAEQNVATMFTANSVTAVSSVTADTGSHCHADCKYPW